MKPIEIFRPGRRTASSGATVEFTAEDLARTAAAYDPAVHEAPLVVGHPTENAPAYGWVKGLSFGQSLQAEPHQVDAAFAELVAAGRYKKISASFYRPDAEVNPVPGVYYLRHVGFLGAQPPAVKGLRGVEFGEAEEGVVEFSDWGDRENAGLWRRLREWLIEKFGAETADQVVPGYAVGTLEDEARAPSPEAMTPLPSTPFTYSEKEPDMTPEQVKSQVDQAVAAALAGQSAEFSEKDAALRAREERLAAREAADRKAGILAFVEGLKSAGHLAPAWEKLGMVSFLESLSGDEALSFGEGETRTKGQLAFMKRFLAELPKLIDFRELATAESEPPAGSGAGAKLEALIAQKRAADASLSYTEASRAVQAENPDLAAAYLDEVRPARK